LAQIDRTDDPRLVNLQALMNEADTDSVFEELDPFGERHGSWQRTMHSWSENLDRYVSVAVNSSDDGDEIAVMAGAEERLDNALSRPKSRRFDVGSVRIASDDVNPWSQRGDVKKLLANAVRMALDIEPVQLEEVQLLAS
jgi:hypothetical protein